MAAMPWRSFMVLGVVGTMLCFWVCGLGSEGVEGWVVVQARGVEMWCWALGLAQLRKSTLEALSLGQSFDRLSPSVCVCMCAGSCTFPRSPRLLKAATAAAAAAAGAILVVVESLGCLLPVTGRMCRPDWPRVLGVLGRHLAAQTFDQWPPPRAGQPNGPTHPTSELTRLALFGAFGLLKAVK